jgi:hypothetical protein
MGACFSNDELASGSALGYPKTPVCGGHRCQGLTDSALHLVMTAGGLTRAIRSSRDQVSFAGLFDISWRIEAVHG